MLSQVEAIPCGTCGCAARLEWVEGRPRLTEPGLEGVQYICRNRRCACHLSPHEGCELRVPWACHEAACPRSVREDKVAPLA